jgi:hypothetical protein
MMSMAGSPEPFDLKTVVLAKHVQTSRADPFPIARFITGVAFDVIAHWSNRLSLADAAYYNLLVAAKWHPTRIRTIEACSEEYAESRAGSRFCNF